MNIYIDRDISDAELQTAIASIYSITPQDVLVINENTRYCKEYYMVYCMKDILDGGEFFVSIALKTESFHTKEISDLQVICKFCQTLQCSALAPEIKGAPESPFETILVNPQGNIKVAYLDIDDKIQNKFTLNRDFLPDFYPRKHDPFTLLPGNKVGTRNPKKVLKNKIFVESSSKDEGSSGGGYLLVMICIFVWAFSSLYAKVSEPKDQRKQSSTKTYKNTKNTDRNKRNTSNYRPQKRREPEYVKDFRKRLEEAQKKLREDLEKSSNERLEKLQQQMYKNLLDSQKMNESVLNEPEYLDNFYEQMKKRNEIYKKQLESWDQKLNELEQKKSQEQNIENDTPRKPQIVQKIKKDIENLPRTKENIARCVIDHLQGKKYQINDFVWKHVENVKYDPISKNYIQKISFEHKGKFRTVIFYIHNGRVLKNKIVK